VSGRTCVIFNPAAGRGRAKQLIESAVKRVGECDLRPTSHPGHAEELARIAAEHGFARIVAAGGDGTVHEVANGILRSGNRDVIFSTWPLGSMNDYAFALGLDRWYAERRGPGELASTLADVGVMRAGDRERYFVNGCGFGFNGMVTLESRRIRSLRGLPLYAAAFARAGLYDFRCPVTTVRLDDSETTSPMLALSVNLAQREGGFPVTPLARIDDGLFDFFHVREVGRRHLVRYFPALVRGTLPADHPRFGFGRCSRVSVNCGEPLCVHTDGELFWVPADGHRAFAVELLRGRLRVEALGGVPLPKSAPVGPRTPVRG
jgi:diacylglycerol kinase family enzyme